MAEFPEDIYTEPEDVDPDTLAHLGPLRALAGVWEGTRGQDVHPAAGGAEEDGYSERYELQPTDPQTNGPQLLYGLRYHTHVLRPNKPETFHDQVGYWLWEPATGRIIHTLAIPRGQVAMASGVAAPDARSFELVAELGSSGWGILSSPFLDYGFKTLEFRLRVTVNADGTWSYEEDTVMRVRGRDALHHHTDRNTLKKVAEPTPNPLLLALRKR